MLELENEITGAGSGSGSSTGKEGGKGKEKDMVACRPSFDDAAYRLMRNIRLLPI